MATVCRPRASPAPDAPTQKPDPGPEGKPLFLTASAVVNPGGSNGVNQIALQNPLGTPMEIHEIHFSGDLINIANSVPAGKAGYSLKVNGAALRCQLALGKVEITAGFVPIFLFGKAPHESGEGNFDRTTGFSRMSYVWKLATPLYVPPGAILSPIFQHSGQIPTSINAKIGYAARSLPMGYRPKHLIMPWVAAYASTPIDLAGSTNTFFNSTELDLVNRWDSPLDVERLTGRFVVNDNTAVAVFDMPFSGLANLTVRLSDSAGNAIVRTPAPFSHVFTNASKSWEMKAQLPAKGFYQAFFELSPVSGLSAQRFFGQALVGLVGSREA